MRSKLLYGPAIALLAVLVILAVWQVSFHFGEYAPTDPNQTFIFWAVSTLIFLLMVTLGFILARTALKLYIERRANREGSRIKTKLVIGALALSFTPVTFLVLFSYLVLNRNIDKWFSKPAEAEQEIFREMSRALNRQVLEEARLQAALLAVRPETRGLLLEGTGARGFLRRYCAEHGLTAAAIYDASGETELERYGAFPAPAETNGQMVVARVPVAEDGKTIGYISLAARLPVDIFEKQQLLERYNRDYQQLAGNRKHFRQIYLYLMALITLFVLFVATWIALFLARQISVPISALLDAAGEIRKGNLRHRVEVGAVDELASLVRAFNEMTRELDANSRELDARRRFTEAILESIPTGVLSVRADGSIQRVNRALRQILAEESVARAARLDDLFSREDVSEIRYLMNRARRTGGASRQFEITRNGRTLHLAVTVAALEVKITSDYVIVIEDTSDLLRAQKAAAWHEVARRVAHEIKNPLTPIGLSAERIGRQLEKVQAPPEVRRIVTECVDNISTSVESVKTLVNEFSRFARFPSAQPVRSDLNEVIESALAVFAGRLDGIEMVIQLTPGLPAVSIDREQFTRVVVNLVDNAAEAMQESLVKQLVIATQPGAADTVELIFADTGCGMTAEQKEKLFLPYFSTKGRGTGLGLAIVAHILTDHQAQIRVEDNLPAGARFVIEIPAAEVAESAHAAI
jgi:PAS domain S-box-containing protein